MQNLDEIKEAPKEVPKERSLTLIAVDLHNQRIADAHRVVNRQVSGYPRMSALEADLMELMGDALGG